MKVWHKHQIEITKGVFAGEFKLSKFPLLGKWKLSATLDQEVSKSALSNNMKISVLNFKLCI